MIDKTLTKGRAMRFFVDFCGKDVTILLCNIRDHLPQPPARQEHGKSGEELLC